MKLLTMTLLFGLNNVSFPVDGAPKTIYNHIITTSKEIALTFDDGPDKTNTPQVLRILEEKGVKATFFMLGENVVKNEEIVKTVVLKGHQIGLHSFTHPNFHKLNYDQIHKEVKSNQDDLYRITGIRVKIVRPPYGIVTNDFLKVAQDLDLSIFTWSNDSFDWKKGNSPTRINNNVFVKLKEGAIVLMHDKSVNQVNSRRALPRVIDNLKKEGYNFVTLRPNMM